MGSIARTCQPPLANVPSIRPSVHSSISAEETVTNIPITSQIYSMMKQCGEGVKLRWQANSIIAPAVNIVLPFTKHPSRCCRWATVSAVTSSRRSPQPIRTSGSIAVRVDDEIQRFPVVYVDRTSVPETFRLRIGLEGMASLARVLTLSVRKRPLSQNHQR